MKKPYLLLLVLGVFSSLCAPSARADAKSEAWFEGITPYLNSKPASGKSPAIYATVTLVGMEPGSAIAGKTPDRTSVWYAHGELERVNFPGPSSLQGKLSMAVNSGPMNAPFAGAGTLTLGITVQGSGDASLHYQVDGRNRLGKGPQSLKLGAVPNASDATTQVFSAATEFFGPKLIVLSLVKGDKVGPAVPAPPAPKPVGARYRVTPVFVVTNSNDGVGDNTVEMQTEIKFFHDGKQVGFLINRTNQGQGGRAARDPFIVETRFDQTPTLNLKISGYVYDYDALGNDEMWRFDRSLSLKGMANAKNGAMKIPSGTIIDGGDATGYLEMKVEKIGDVF